MSKPDFSIRPATNNDRDQWGGLWQGYLRFYRADLPEDHSNLLWRRILDPEDEIECRVACDGEHRLLGLVHFFPHAHTWTRAPVCYLNDLFVEPDIRGGGIGAALIEAVVERARERGWNEVYWQTHQDNAVARGLYDKITGGTDGFVIYSIDVSASTG